MIYIIWFLVFWFVGTIAIVLHQTDHYKRHSADYWLSGLKWPWLAFLEFVGLLVWVKRRMGPAFERAMRRWID